MVTSKAITSPISCYSNPSTQLQKTASSDSSSYGLLPYYHAEIHFENQIHVDRTFFSFNTEQNKNISPYLVLRGLYLTPITVQILLLQYSSWERRSRAFKLWWQHRIQCLKKYSSKYIVDVFILLLQAFQNLDPSILTAFQPKTGTNASHFQLQTISSMQLLTSLFISSYVLWAYRENQCKILKKQQK